MFSFFLQAALAWALGQIGRHTPEHAKQVAVTQALKYLLKCYLNTESSEDLQAKVTGMELNYKRKNLFGAIKS